MTVLTDVEIKELIKQKNLIIEPFNERLLGPASYDARAGSRALKSIREGSPLVNVELEEVLQIGTGEFVELFTLEKFNLPKNVCGRMGLRSFFTRKGLILFAGPQIDPGFMGHLIVSLFNTGPRPIILKYGDDFCTVEFVKLDRDVEKPYEGPYQDQDKFPTDNIEFIVGAKGVTLYEVVKVMEKLSSDMKWVKWLLLAIFAALLAAIVTRLF